MAKGVKELKTRIRGVGNIKQITRAMEMVAQTKLRRLQARAEGASPYANRLRELVGALAARVDSSSSPLFEVREVQKIALIVVTSDRGLCGAYNSNIFRSVAGFLESTVSPCHLHVFGRKGVSLYRKTTEFFTGYEDAPETMEFRRASKIMKSLHEAFIEREVDEVHILYTRFISSANLKVTRHKLLPIDPKEIGGDEIGNKAEPILEPSAEEVFDALLPKYLEVGLFTAVLEAVASEFAMRRMAMKAATDAASDMISDLTRQYNRARQETITTELMDIIGGAEALS